jgi:hypothetical protein
VTLSNSDISGLGSAATLNAGSSSGNLVQLDGSGKIPSAFLPAVSGTVANLDGDVSGTTAASVVVAVGGKSNTDIANSVNDVQGATSANTAGTIVKRDGSGNFSSNIISSSSNSTLNLYLFDSTNSIRLKAPSGLGSNLVLTLPSGNGSGGQFLQTDGSGNLSWASVSSSGGTVTSVTASAPLSSSGGASPNISIAVGTASGTVAAGNDSRITGALQASDYSADVAGAASCSNIQTPYWDSIADAWACANIAFPADAVTSVAGRTGAVTLTSSDISGLGSAASQNVGTSSGNVVQLDGSGKLPSSVLPSSLVNSVSATSPLISSGGSSPTISIAQASGSASGYLTSADWTVFNSKQAALGFTPLNPANNLSDVSNAATARSNLGLGSASGLNVGTTSGTVAAGDDSRITGALQSSAYNSDVAAAASCTNTQTPYWDSIADAWACANIAFPADAVTSVAGRTGAVVLTSSDISGLGSAATLNAGTSPNNLVQLDAGSKIPTSTLPGSVVLTSTSLAGDVSGTIGASTVVSVGGKTSAQIVSSVNDTVSATSVNTAGTIVKRDASGNFSAGEISASSVSAGTVTTVTVNTNAVNASTVSATSVSSSNSTADNLFLRSGANTINLKAPAGLGSDLTLNLPSNNGSAGQVLLTDGAGNLSWANVSAAGGTVNSVTASAPLSSSGGANPNISLTQASGSSAGYLSSADWTTFNNKQAALGFTPVDVSAYNADLAPAASCTTSQTAYWNTVSDTWACQAITFPVTSVAGRTGDVTLTSSDISGLGTAAVLNAGASASNVVQLDGTARIPASTLPANAVTTATALSGDVTGTITTMSVDRIKGFSVSGTTPVTGQALVYNGTQWVPAYGVSRYSRATADQSTTSTTAVNATNMVFAVTAGNVYKYKFSIMYTSTNGNNGLKLGLTYPAATAASALANIAAATDGTGAYYQGVINASGDVVTALTTAATAPLVMFSTVEGIIVPSASGNVQLMFGSETNTQTIVLKAGSYVEYSVVP